MASFPSSWVLETGRHRTGPRSPNVSPSFASPPKPPKYQPSEAPSPSTPLNRHMMPPLASADLDKPPSSGWQSLPTKSKQYATSFPMSWLLKTSTAASPNNTTLYHNIVQVGSPQSLFTSHLSVSTGAATSSTALGSPFPVRTIHPTTAERQTGGFEAAPHNQGNTCDGGFGSGPASTGEKDKQEDTRAWLQSLAQTSLEQQRKESVLTTGSKPAVDEGGSVGYDDGLSDFSGHGDVPYNTPKVSDTYGGRSKKRIPLHFWD